MTRLTPDPRYFLPGPVEDMEDGLERIRNDLDIRGRQSRPWPQAEPIKNHQLRGGETSSPTGMQPATPGTMPRLVVDSVRRPAGVSLAGGITSKMDDLPVACALT